MRGRAARPRASAEVVAIDQQGVNKGLEGEIGRRHAVFDVRTLPVAIAEPPCSADPPMATTTSTIRSDVSPAKYLKLFGLRLVEIAVAMFAFFIALALSSGSTALDLGLFVVLAAVTGFIGAVGVVVGDRAVAAIEER
ncbi:MAG: hypothetical protein ACOCY1_03540 [Halovenus sp.]